MAHSVRIKREKERLHARGVHHNLIQIQLIKLSPDNIKTIPLNMCIVHFVDCKKTHRACLCVCAVYTVHLRYIYRERAVTTFIISKIYNSYLHTNCCMAHFTWIILIQDKSSATIKYQLAVQLWIWKLHFVIKMFNIIAEIYIFINLVLVICFFFISNLKLEEW